MKIRIDDDRRVQPEDMDDLGSLVAESALSSERLVTLPQHQPQAIARGERGALWIRIQFLVQSYQGTRADWRAGFERTLDFAAARGWVDQGRTMVRAHIRAT
jgi:hypothetical protein